MTRSKKTNLAERKDIKAKMEQAVAELKTSCKDAAFFDRQIDRILSLKGQLDTEAVRLMVKESDVLKEYKGETFYVAVTKNGAMYHTYGGYTLFADNRNAQSLYLVLESIVDSLLKGEQDEMEYADVMAKMHVIAAPTWCFTDAEATYNIASTVVSELNRMVEKIGNEPLREEDEEANHAFEDAAMAADHIDRKLKEEKK